MKVTFSAAIAGVALGLFGGPVWILLPWGIAGLVIGYFSKIRKQSLINGAVFGFLAVFFFMIRGYAGAMPIVTKLPFFALIGVIGLVSGAIASFAGYILYKGIKK